MRRYNISPITIILLAVIAVESMLTNPYGSVREWLVAKILVLPAIFIAMSFHEYAHAKVAELCGDSTPREMGRVTINPAAHVDLMGLFTLLFFGFGWGRPVEVDPGRMRNKRRDLFLVSIAGVVTNFILATLFAGLYVLLWKKAYGFLSSSLGEIVSELIVNIIGINLVLCIFNLIPVPPLDGFNIITEVFNLRQSKFYVNALRYGSWILLAMIVFNVTDAILTPCVNGLYHFLITLFL